jgi:hypothetical protein
MKNFENKIKTLTEHHDHGTKNTGEIHEKIAHGHHVLELRLQGKYMKKSPMVTTSENQESLSK